jgi:hypothetical protein
MTTERGEAKMAATASARNYRSRPLVGESVTHRRHAAVALVGRQVRYVAFGTLGLAGDGKALC